MSDEIEPSSIDWEPVPGMEEWETEAIGRIRGFQKHDFKEEDLPANAKLTYMGASPLKEVAADLLKEDADDKTRNQQVTAWRLRYAGIEEMKVAPSKDGIESENNVTLPGESVEFYRGWMFVRPGRPTRMMLACGVLWCQGFQVGRGKMSNSTRNELRRQFHELAQDARENMPPLTATAEEDQEINVEVEDEITDTLETVLEEIPGGFRVDLPPFSVEVEEDETDAPTPRPETEEMDPDPFGGGAADVLSNVFTLRTNRALMEADGEPAPTYQGEWGQDSTGHPIRVEQLGNPYEGRATFKVQAFGEPDPAAVEASMGWKMLDRIEMDTVWLNLLLLSYASATHRRGDRPTIRIGRRTVEKVFGYTNDNYTMEERAKKIRRHVEALQSIFVQFQNVRRHGDKLHFKGDMAGGAPLWNLRMVAEGEKDLFTGQTVADWHLEAREGLWATEFLHNHGDQFTPLPKEWFKKIDRRGSRNYAQRLAAYLLFQFRINAKNGARVKRRAATLLEVCGEDMNESRDTRRRSELKRCLSKALDTLDRDYGIEVHADRVHMDQTSGMSFNTWKNRTVEFAPPASIEGRIFQGGDGDAPPLPDVAGDWTPEQIRHLRTEVIGDTQEDFGEKLYDVTKQYISQLERGTSDPSTRVRKRLDALHSRYS